MLREYRRLSTARQIDNPISPRGDGNSAKAEVIVDRAVQIDNPISPRGDGNLERDGNLEDSILIDNPISPRGDGNMHHHPCTTLAPSYR